MFEVTERMLKYMDAYFNKRTLDLSKRTPHAGSFFKLFKFKS